MQKDVIHIKVSLMAAMDKNGVIGKNNDIPWRLSREWEYVKNTTIGHPIILGRKNFESNGKALCKRRNIIPMIIKRIRCKVKEDHRHKFYLDQQQWRVLNGVQGFLGQFGGWSKDDHLTACIYSFWASEEHYDFFMKEVHDNIFINSGQGKTYSSINVTLFIEKMAFPNNKLIISQMLSGTEFIRIAAVQVKEDKVKHFEDMQLNVWNMEMSRTEGMQGGIFARSIKEDNSFLVLSGWENEKLLQSYVQHILPDLLRRSNAKMDALVIEGEQFKLEEHWSVIPLLKI